MRPRTAALVILLFLAAGLHVSPVVFWRFSLEPELARGANADRLRAQTIRDLPRAPADWSTLAVRGVSVRAPIRDDQLAECSTCTGGCALALDEGRLTVFDDEPWADADVSFDWLAPDSRDVSLWRSAWANWRTIQALTGRTRMPGGMPLTYRFEVDGWHGVVSPFLSRGVQRYVVYAYAPDGAPAPTLGLSRVSEDVLHRVIGSIGLPAAGDDPSSCTARGPRTDSNET